MAAIYAQLENESWQWSKLKGFKATAALETQKLGKGDKGYTSSSNSLIIPAAVRAQV